MIDNMSNLFLIVGNSGSGKDSLIKEVQKHFPKHLKEIKVPIRVITRPPSPETENFESIDVDSFIKLKKNGEFALDWHIYGLYYGIRKIINDWLSSGHSVLINVSRKIIPTARSKYPNVKIIFVKVPFEITEKRIRERARENEEIIQMRLERAKQNQDLPSADFVLDNSGDLESAGNALLNYILSELESNQS
ncbi:MAG: phosphonate metabolism protein/1,5-bisphosphokinase (PRPP-forming) PhnN [Candidatus Helarchaeota archaeon]